MKLFPSHQEMPKSMGLIALDGTPWDGPWLNRQQILSRLAALIPIVYSNGLLFTWQRRQTNFNQYPLLPRFDLRGALELDRPSRALLRWRRVSVLDQLMIRAHARRLVRRVRRRGAGPVTGYIFHPAFGAYARSGQFDRLVYHLYDSYEHTPGWNATLTREHAVLMDTADVVIASSPDLARSLTERFGRTVETVTNGVDFDAFSAPDLPEPAALRDIPRPRIGHIGRLNRKIDFALVAELAARRPDWQFVLVGPVANLDQPAREGLEGCRGLANVWFIEEQPHACLPAFTAHMDVNAMFYAQRDDLWTAWVFPLKLHEYLATGQPVVASPLPCLTPFSHVVALAGTPDGWVSRLEDALRGKGVGDAAARREVARCNAWDSKVQRIHELIHSASRADVESGGTPAVGLYR